MDRLLEEGRAEPGELRTTSKHCTWDTKLLAAALTRAWFGLAFTQPLQCSSK